MLKGALGRVSGIFSRKMQERREKKAKLRAAQEKVIRYKIEWELDHLEELTTQRLRELAKKFPKALLALDVRLENNIKKEAERRAVLNTVEKQEEIKRKKEEKKAQGKDFKEKLKKDFMQMAKNVNSNRDKRIWI